MTGIRSLLREAAPQPTGEADVTALAHRARMRRRSRHRTMATVISTACVAAVTVGVLWAAGYRGGTSPQRVTIKPLTDSTTTATATAPNPQVLPFSPQPDYRGTLPADGMYPAWPQLHVRLQLQATTVAAGTPIRGQLVITNDGTHPIARYPSHSCSTSFVVALESPTYKPLIAWTTSACTAGPGAPAAVWPPGVTTVSFSVLTTYNGCGAPPPAVPCAADGGAPSLPPGTYHTFVASNGMALPQPPPVTVILR